MKRGFIWSDMSKAMTRNFYEDNGTNKVDSKNPIIGGTPKVVDIDLPRKKRNPHLLRIGLF